jgi:hypothetical protein
MQNRKVDHNALRVNQAFIISLLVLAFILQIPALVGFVSAVMIIGTIFPQAGLFKRIYRHALLPAGLIKPDVQEDNPEPHLFAQGLGGVFTLASMIALIGGVEVIGWALAWIVIALAALNLFAGFCAGCFVYYQLSRRGILGFSVQPLQNN